MQYGKFKDLCVTRHIQNHPKPPMNADFFSFFFYKIHISPDTGVNDGVWWWGPLSSDLDAGNRSRSIMTQWPTVRGYGMQAARRGRSHMQSCILLRLCSLDVTHTLSIHNSYQSRSTCFFLFFSSSNGRRNHHSVLCSLRWRRSEGCTQVVV